MDDVLKKIEEWGKEKRTIPFFTFNDDMNADKIREQINEMSKVGIGGVFIHARSGLKTAYLGEEWFLSVDVCIDECEKRGMQVWIYDEFGWPSGIADGAVIKNKDFCIRWLEYEKTADGTGAVKIGGSDGYVDVFDPKATDAFIACTHEKYKARYGGRIRGFFTDEPQYGLHHIPYSRILKEKYEEDTGRKFEQDCLALFEEREDGENIREKYFSLAANLFYRNYTEKLADWCEKNGYRLTGHYLEESLVSLQVESAGNLPLLYSVMQAPGMDWLGRTPGTDNATPRQVSSVCRQFGKRDNIAESYACAGYGAEIDELKSIADWEFSNGINHICMVFPHSFRGRRKRDYPSGLMPENPMFPVSSDFFTYLNRLGGIVTNGEERADVLVLAPLRKMMRIFGEKNKMREIDLLYHETLTALENAHINFHISNADLLERFGEIENERYIKLGKKKYDAVVSLDSYFPPVLAGFEKSGRLIKGHTGSEKEIARFLSETINALADKTFLREKTDGAIVSEYYVDGKQILIVRNPDRVRKTVTLKSPCGGYLTEICLETLKSAFPIDAVSENTVVLQPLQCRFFSFVEKREKDVPRKILSIESTDWTVAEEDDNALPLDKCVPVINGKRYPVMPLIELNDLLARIGKSRVEMRFDVVVREIPSESFLGIENGERFFITVNGKKITKSCGSSQGGTFDLYPVFLKKGRNSLILSCDYEMSPKLVAALNSMEKSESDFNRVADTMDLENIYLFGNFGVEYQGQAIISDGGNGVCIGYDGNFSVGRRSSRIDIAHIARGGRMFFSGKLTLEKRVNIEKIEGEEYYLAPHLRGFVAKIYVNGNNIGTCLWNGTPLNATEFLKNGENIVRVEAYGNLRNLFGPFHNKFGNPDMVGFTTFTATPGWCDPQEALWTDDYYVSDTGLDFCKIERETQH